MSWQRTIFSPDGQIRCEINIKKGHIFYNIKKNEVKLIKDSELYLETLDLKNYFKNLKKPEEIRFCSARHEEKIEMQWGEDHFIENNYIEASIDFGITIRFRIFNNGIAFRYELPRSNNSEDTIIIKHESTEFNLDLDSSVWKIPAYMPDRYEYNYEKARILDLTESVHTPLTIKTPHNIYLSIHEAALYDYGSMTIKLNKKNVLFSDIIPLSDNTKAHVKLPFKTPWRLVMIEDNAIDLPKNRIMYCLNDPPKGDFSWVKTIKFIGIWWAMYVGEWTWAPGEKHGATTEHAKTYLDAAVRLGIKGLLIEGWNEGWEGDWLENGINNKFTISTPDFDMDSVASYAESRGIELIGHHETVGFVDNYEAQLEKAYNYYLSHGVSYIKTGYAGSMITINGKKEYHHSQAGVNHYQKTVELAAKKKICLDIHEPIKGTGIERTWPNLLSREGARGQEYEGGAISPSHACFLPYTRLLSGGMDYTPGIFDIENPIKRIHTTLARQVAYFVVIYSGMVMAADRPSFYEENPTLFKFIKEVPTNFEKSLPLIGEIGEYFVIARKDRNSSNWYIGGVTNEDSRLVTLNLDFLESEKYLADFYLDAKDADFEKNPLATKIERKVIKKNDHIDIYMARGGGFAISLKPLQSNDV